MAPAGLVPSLWLLRLVVRLPSPAKRPMPACGFHFRVSLRGRGGICTRSQCQHDDARILASRDMRFHDPQRRGA